MSGGFLTPKAIANRIKAKGLQKLRWYCQMCEKQCRDENGFKCHAQSESHLRNMQIYAQNPRQFKEKFSTQFERSFLKELSRRHHTNTVKANTFYAEYITDKDHLHMNATKWSSLTEFIKDLGRRGLVRVEEQEQGWFITYIDRSVGAAETEAERAARKEKTVLDDAERDRRRVEAQLRAARKQGHGEDSGSDGDGDGDDDDDDLVPSELVRGEDEAPVAFAFAAPVIVGVEGGTKRDAVAAFGDEDDDGAAAAATAAQGPQKNAHRPLSALEEIKAREEERRKRHARAPPEPSLPRGWLAVGCHVKVRNKVLSNGEYYNKKGIVIATYAADSVADVEMRDSGDVIRVAAAQLETVLPIQGGRVLVVDGPRKGRRGTLERINEADFNAAVTLEGGERATFPYEHICKISN